MNDDPAPIRPGEELAAGPLEQYLRAQLPGAAESLVIQQFPSGHSNLTYLVKSGGSEWVLRRPPFGNKVKTAHDMGREFRVLSKLWAVFPAAPRPFLLCEDESVLGAPFYLMERRRGLILRRRAPGDAPPEPAQLRAMSFALIDTLVALHALDYRQAGLADLGKPEGYTARQVAGWTRRYRDAETGPQPDVDAVIDWLQKHPPTEGGACIVHNDFKFDNVIFDPRDATRVVAVLDWEMATLGDPMMDLGTTLGYWTQADDPADLRTTSMGPTMLPGALTRREVVSYYAAKSGRDAAGSGYAYVFGLFKIAVIVQQIYARFVRGHTRDPRFANMAANVAALGKQAARTIETNQL